MSNEWLDLKYLEVVCYDCPAHKTCNYPNKDITTYCPAEYYERYRYPALSEKVKKAIEKEQSNE